jgi:hypothetical protein
VTQEWTKVNQPLMLEWLKLKEMILDLLKVNQERIWEALTLTKAVEMQTLEITQTTKTTAEITQTTKTTAEITQTTKTKITQTTKNRKNIELFKIL